MIRLFRQRYIPSEIVPLDDDEILFISDDRQIIITKWNILRPRKDALQSGLSCYFIAKNLKLSALFDNRGAFMHYYADFILTDVTQNSFVFRDLLVDVTIQSNGCVQILDLDELAEAHRKKLITETELDEALLALHQFLKDIYEGRFEEMSKLLDQYNVR